MNRSQLAFALLLLVSGWLGLGEAQAQAHIHLPGLMETMETSPFMSGINLTCRAHIEWVNEPAFLAHFSEAKPGALRLPGGTFSNSYNWKAGLQNTEIFNLKHAFAFADSMDMKINYVLNFGTTTAHEAAEFVRLCNSDSPAYEAQRAVYFNRSEPVGIQIWELGNELAARWEWHVSWVAGGQHTSIFYDAGDSLYIPRSVTDSLHYYGGSLWRSGWVPEAGDGMNKLNSMLGTFYRVRENDGPVFDIQVEFPPIHQDSVQIWAVSDSIPADLIETATQQQLYSAITQTPYLLDASDYTILGDSAVRIDPGFSLDTNNVVLVEYKTHHPGAFEIRDSMLVADPGIEVGYCIDFRQNLLNNPLDPDFADRLEQSPPRFLIQHPYNSDTDFPVNNGYFHEVMHKVDEKIEGQFVPMQDGLDSIMAAIGSDLPIGIALTEWNIRLCGPGGCLPAYNGILGGLFTANFYSQCTQAHADELIDLRVSNHFACLATGNNLIHMYHHVDGPSADSTLITPQAEALRMVNKVMRNNLLPSSAYAVTDNPEVDLFFMGEDALGNPILDSTLSAALKIFVSETREDESGAVPGSQGSLGRIDILVLNNDDNAAHEVTLHLPCDRTVEWAALETMTGDTAAADYWLALDTLVVSGDSLVFSVPTFAMTTLRLPYSVDVLACPCAGDINEDGIQGIGDLLLLLSYFGCTGPNCAGDLDRNHVVGVGDMLMFLSLFGGACSG